jgi:hypothetical protein
MALIVLENDNDLFVDEDLSMAAGPALSAAVRNFPVGGHHLGQRHINWLHDVAAPFLKRPGAILEAYGSASRTGPADLNARLSDLRLDGVQVELYLGGAPGNICFMPFRKALGESPAQLAGDAEGNEDLKFRSVFVFLWPDSFARFNSEMYLTHKKFLDFARGS